MRAGDNAIRKGPSRTGTTRIWPTTVAELDPTENLVVWSYRSWAIAVQAGGQQRWRLLRYEFRRQFGAAACEAALDRFSVLMRQLGSHARAPLQYHAPCCPCLGQQEVGVMSLVAACQARQWSLARRIAGRLVQANGIGAVIAAAAGVAESLRRHLPSLPLRLTTDADDAVVAVHESGHRPGATAVPAGATIH